MAKLVHDFKCTEAEKMLTKPLADKTRYLKEKQEAVNNMCKAIEEIRNELKKEISVELAYKLIIKNVMSYEEIADLTGLTLDEKYWNEAGFGDITICKVNDLIYKKPPLRAVFCIR